MRRTKGFCLYEDGTQIQLTDSDGKPILFTDYQKYIQWAKKNRINYWDYRVRPICKRFTKSYLVI